jgi:hypothetical protein
VYKDWGLTLEKYWIFLNAVESDKVDSPTLEKSSRFKLEFLEEGDNSTCVGEEETVCELFAWYDFHKEFASKLVAEELLYLTELPTKVE